MKTNIKPLGERVLIEPSEQKEITKSGIIIPDTAKEKPQEGKVLAVGVKVKEVKANDKVLFSTYSGDEIKMEGKDAERPKELKIIEEKDILAIISS
ncbi:MAG: Co-chaperonin GroES [Candidatus Berkelbacteria bacterium Licking1014_2]|uniref:Co-chaperonin GroES n=1 Tax=Candidatus Berkelbacteria bacterium Licking1014_2 TaxID=2017146 RepID=A0A554LX41_9BACT|nr:MAG: Co-chaperonin GroES [Candidatus Berkelbacteria bacterium Licking1014_2]